MVDCVEKVNVCPARPATEYQIKRVLYEYLIRDKMNTIDLQLIEFTADKIKEICKWVREMGYSYVLHELSKTLTVYNTTVVTSSQN